MKTIGAKGRTVPRTQLDARIHPMRGDLFRVKGKLWLITHIPDGRPYVAFREYKHNLTDISKIRELTMKNFLNRVATAEVILVT